MVNFDAPAVVSREFRCVSMLPLWLRVNSVAFRGSRCGFARIPTSRGLFRPLLGGPLRLPTATARAVGRVLGFDAPGFDAPAVVSCEFRPLMASSGLFWGGHLGCRPMVSTLPLWFRTTNSVAFRCCRCGFARIPLHFDAPAVVSREFRPLVASSGLGFDAPAVVSREFRCVSMLPLWFCANSVAFRCSPCVFARIPASRGLFRPVWGG